MSPKSQCKTVFIAELHAMTGHKDAIDLNDIQVEDGDDPRTKILIFEDQVFQQIALENILYDELGLKKHVRFYNSGTSISSFIEFIFE